MPANNAHLIFIAIGEVMVVTDDALQTRYAISTRAIRQVIVLIRPVVLLVSIAT